MAERIDEIRARLAVAAMPGDWQLGFDRENRTWHLVAWIAGVPYELAEGVLGAVDHHPVGRGNATEAGLRKVVREQNAERERIVAEAHHNHAAALERAARVEAAAGELLNNLPPASYYDGWDFGPPRTKLRAVLGVALGKEGRRD